MEWLIIVLVLMFVIAPVMWLKPSPRQARVSRLRTAATQEGVTVKLAKPPLHEVRGTMPSYRWTYPPQRPGPRFMLVRNEKASEALKTFRPGWRWRIEPLRPLPAAAEDHLVTLLERLPQDALVLESDREALTMWWYESQQGERFVAYAQNFAALRDALAGRPDRQGSAPVES